MKNEIRLALLCMAGAAVPALAQGNFPECGSSNFDKARALFTVIKPRVDAVNQHCFITVYPTGAVPAAAKKSPRSYMPEGNYTIELSGGGGGGGGGASGNRGGGGAGAGAIVTKTAHYLSPGVYKLTLGTGGEGGAAQGGRVLEGNPSNMINVSTGQLVAGLQGADTWVVRTPVAHSDGRGGAGSATNAGGGSGGDSGPRSEERAQSGDVAQGAAGRAGNERAGGTQANAGGGGGGSLGKGGEGASAGTMRSATAGELGGGGGGGRGGLVSSTAGARGGHGFIKISM